MNGHRDMRDHLIVNEFITLGEHYISVKSQYLAEFRSIENIDLLVIALTRIKMSCNPEAVTYIRRMIFTEP